jgi:hypothetical protein
VEEVKTGEKSASLHLHRRVRRKTGKTDHPNQRNNKKEPSACNEQTEKRKAEWANWARGKLGQERNGLLAFIYSVHNA